jgi:hypothetical protein
LRRIAAATAAAAPAFGQQRQFRSRRRGLGCGGANSPPPVISAWRPASGVSAIISLFHQLGRTAAPRWQGAAHELRS